jgi:hypothetical protein
MPKKVWHAHARKYVEVGSLQWHGRACKPGRYEIDERRADPAALAIADRDMEQRPDESDLWFDESMEYLAGQDAENIEIQRYWRRRHGQRPKSATKRGWCGPDDSAARKAMIDQWLADRDRLDAA